MRRRSVTDAWLPAHVARRWLDTGNTAPFASTTIPRRLFPALSRLGDTLRHRSDREPIRRSHPRKEPHVAGAKPDPRTGQRALGHHHHSSYEIAIDLTDGAGGPGEKTFRTAPSITFDAEPGASTFVDFVGDGIAAATLNGRELDVGSWTSTGGLPLADLAATTS